MGPPSTDEAKSPSRVCPTCQGRFEGSSAFCPKDGSPLIAEGAKESSSLVGQVLADRYRILKKIGEGGMGQVYEAQHVYIDKKFALKLLRPEITSDPEAVARFHQEARSASTIGHENIVEIDDFGRLPDGSVYLAMEYLQGDSLADLMHEAPLELELGLDYLAQVCDGLAAAHEKGIVHRDMKPENVFITEKNHKRIAKILDFGIAKVTGSDGEGARLTRTGAVFGTPHYMSPEQALGKSLDARSDIYSVGVILYEVITGSVPFQAETFMGILTQHLTQPPEAPHLRAPNRQIPRGIEDIVLRAMAKEPGDRQQSIAKLGQDLRGVMAGGEASVATSAAALGVLAYAPTMAPASGERSIVTKAPSALRDSQRPQQLGVDSPPPEQSIIIVQKKFGPALPIAIGLGLALAGVGGFAVYSLRRPEVPLPTSAIGLKTGLPTTPVTPLPAATNSVVRVESTPTGAQVFGATGNDLAGTPATLTVPPGGSDVTVHLPGYVDVKLHLLPTPDGKPIRVALERDKGDHAHDHGAHTAAAHVAGHTTTPINPLTGLPQLPPGVPVVADPPPKPEPPARVDAPVVHEPPRADPPRADPPPRVAAPHKRPTASPKPGQEVPLDPY